MAKYANKVKGNGATSFQWADASSLVCRLDELTPEMIRELAVHGLGQKVGDSYAGAMSLAEAKANAERVWENLKNGMWSGERASGTGDLAEAIHMATGQSVEECEALVAGMDKDKKAAARKIPQVASALASIKAKRLAAKAGADTDEGKDKLAALFG